MKTYERLTPSLVHHEAPFMHIPAPPWQSLSQAGYRLIEMRKLMRKRTQNKMRKGKEKEMETLARRAWRGLSGQGG